mmetsp:Transcript_13673/g.27189  ORF Transcript_13673/g.27189 Transcript_13673/m.27189 type:complete len:99 (+) Transcript_13673:702-998(+)
MSLRLIVLMNEHRMHEQESEGMHVSVPVCQTCPRSTFFLASFEAAARESESICMNSVLFLPSFLLPLGYNTKESRLLVTTEVLHLAALPLSRLFECIL